jgi:hypothetical protein
MVLHWLWSSPSFPPNGYDLSYVLNLRLPHPPFLHDKMRQKPCPLSPLRSQPGELR